MDELEEMFKSLKDDLKKAEKYYRENDKIIFTYAMIGERIKAIEKKVKKDSSNHE